MYYITLVYSLFGNLSPLPSRFRAIYNRVITSAWSNSLQNWPFTIMLVITSIRAANKARFCNSGLFGMRSVWRSSLQTMFGCFAARGIDRICFIPGRSSLIIIKQFGAARLQEPRRSSHFRRRARQLATRILNEFFSRHGGWDGVDSNYQRAKAKSRFLIDGRENY